MSHIAAVECEVRDLDVLRAAGERLGFEFMEGQRTHRWFGRFLNDWRSDRAAVAKGYDPATFGTCDHALRQKANPSGYEVGVTAQDDGTYRLVYDSFGSGYGIEALAGPDLMRLRNEVAAEQALRFARQRGYRVQREDGPAQIRLVLRQ